MNKTLSVMVAAAMVVAMFVGATVTARNRMQNGGVGHRQGVMPEVVVRAELPRLVMPTVEVHAFRSVAASSTSGDVF